MWKNRLFSMMALLPLAAVAGPVDLRLIKDIDTSPTNYGSDPAHFQRVGNLVYFNAHTTQLGVELYATDGTPGPAQLVYDFAPGTASSYAKALGMAGGRLIVEAEDSVQGTHLLALDRATGTRTTLRVLGASGTQQSRMTHLVAQLGGHLLFRTYDHLYTTDGSVAGTRRLFEGVTYSSNLSASVCPLPGGGALVVRPNEGGGSTLWRTDGPPASNRVIATLAQESNLYAVAAGGSHGYLLFSRGNGWGLWRSDGNSANLIAQQGEAAPRGLAAASTFAYVADSVGASQQRLWKSNSAVPVVSYPLSNGMNWGADLKAVGDRVVFNGPYRDGSYERGVVYVSDGSAAGSARVGPVEGMYDINPDYAMAVSGSSLLLGNSANLWKIDTAARTARRVGDGFNTYSTGASAELGGAIIAAHQAATEGHEVFRNDGSATQPQLLHDLRQGTRGGLAGIRDSGIAIGNTLYFNDVIDMTSPWGGRLALWRSDGSDAGTQPLARSAYGESSVGRVLRVGDQVAFTSAPSTSTDLYLADAGLTSAQKVLQGISESNLQGYGDALSGGLLSGCGSAPPAGYGDLCALGAGTAQAALVMPGLLRNGQLRPVGSLGNVAVFFVDGNGFDGTDGLWRSDGTTPGTFRISPDLQFRSTSAPTVAIEFNGRLLFGGCDMLSGYCGVFSTDATATSPQPLAELPFSTVFQFARVGSKVAFTGGEQRPQQLWISDGTPTGTDLLRAFPGGMSPLATLRGRLHFIVSSEAQPSGTATYYLSDGTKSGTYAVAVPAQLSPDLGFLRALDDDTSVFSCYRKDVGYELCLANGDGSGIRLVGDLYPGSWGSYPSFIGQTSEAAYFSVDDGVHGRELWQLKPRGDLVFADRFEH